MTFTFPRLCRNVAMFISIYTIGAWSNNRRLASSAAPIMMVAMMVWLLISTYFAIGNAADEADSSPARCRRLSRTCSSSG